LLDLPYFKFDLVMEKSPVAVDYFVPGFPG
jgi:hypothetical protein